MRRALLVTGFDPCAAPEAEVARLAQVSRLLSAEGFICDHLSISEVETDGGLPVSLPGVAGYAFARMSKDEAKRADRAGALEALVRGLSPAGAHDLIFQCGTAVCREMYPGVPRVFDAFDGNVRAWADWGSDLFLAADEQMRQAGGGNSGASARWPLELPDASACAKRGTHVGWVGGIDAPLVERWRDLLDRLVGRGLMVPQGLLLPANVRVPAALRRGAASTAGYSETAQMHALGLGLLPGGQPAHHLCRIVRLVAQGVPVLTTPQIAARFEDRWKLPVSDNAEGFLDWLHGWVDGRDRERLVAATAETAAAMRRDLVIMTAYVAGRLRQVTAPERDAVPVTPY